ncbi:MAG: hypothetical protein MJ240_03190 [Kiritimatiellae bacterium]|nr:hypothetical protein [Kiritimatiellia bacterium]
MSCRHLFLFLVFALSSWACLADAESSVTEQLKNAGLDVGYDEAKQRFVVIGTAERKLPDLSRGLFDKARNDLGKIAALNARRELMYMLDINIKAKDTIKATVKAGMTVNEIRSVIEHFSKVKLSGCKVLCTAESYDKSSGNYQVALAIGWSQKVFIDAEKTSKGEWRSVDDDDRYEAWCKRNDLSGMIGSRDFTDTDGLRRYVGIGVVDVDGLKGKPLAMAMRKAAAKAKENLIFSLSVDTAAHDAAQRMVRETSYGVTESRQLWEKFESMVFASYSGAFVNRNQREVYSTIGTNPLTGRKMQVSVYGVTASQ